MGSTSVLSQHTNHDDIYSDDAFAETSEHNVLLTLLDLLAMMGDAGKLTGYGQ